jgi:hypothetical protein
MAKRAGRTVAAYLASTIYITVMSFTNTLPVRRLDWMAGRAVDLRMVFCMGARPHGDCRTAALYLP